MSRDEVKVKVEERKYNWVGSFIRDDKTKAYYNSIRITDKVTGSNLYKIGDIVYFKSDTSQPYIAEIDSLYEIKSTGKKHVMARWYYRTQDIRDLAPKALDHVAHKRYSEVFHSEMKDENDVLSILSHLKVLFFHFDDEEIANVTAGQSEDTFICRYKFCTTSFKVNKLKPSEISSMQTNYGQTKAGTV